MSENNQRRDFINKMLLGVSSLFVMPALAKAEKTTDNMMENEQTQHEPVIKVKPLGFQWETADPFLFCVHHEDKFPKGNDSMGPDASLLAGRQIGQDFLLKDGWRMYHGDKVPGFPGHPHRGFETITVVREGLVDHADSMGAAGRYGNGDVQWMTAGKGVQHSEMFPLLNKDKGNPMELFQIWLNLPKKNKMVNPHFKMLWRESIPKYIHKDAGGKTTEVEVIAGKLGDKKASAPPPDSWAAPAENEVAVWNIKLQPSATWTVPAASAGINRTLYFYKGSSVQLGGKSIAPYHAAEVRANQPLVIKNGNDEARLLLLQGKPIGEPVVQYGPFVMNTKEEIQKAFEDYQNTRFGGWPWKRADQVHDRSKGRFALHADGKEEIKS
jgi:redox-sensitive bicupin YhaK (pirin superfamily)